jgi:hypothetical protein
MEGQLDLVTIMQLLAGQDQQREMVRSMRMPTQSVPAPQNPQTQTSYNEATQAMGLTPQEQFLYQHHLNNLYGGGRVVQPTGDVSTLLQAVVTGPDGRYYNIPTVWGGQVLEPDQARAQAAQVGWDKWPAYDSPDVADKRYGDMHDYLEKDTGAWIKQNPNYRSEFK